jgi:hypothetical protein
VNYIEKRKELKLQTLFTSKLFNVPVSVMRIAVAARSNALNVFACSDTGIVGSNPTQSMDVCLC